MEDKLCPCGSGEEFINCCEVYLKGQKSAESPEKLMRSRYSAFVKGDFDYVKSTWHPDTVPELADDEPNDWIGLEILNAASDDCEGEVEFIAKLIFANKLEIIHEVSDFEKIDGKWLYVSGEFKNEGYKPRKISKNEDCPCGSGLKFKRCHYK